MIIDTSVLIALLQQEKDAAFFAKQLVSASTKKLSTVSLLEAGLIMRARYGDQGGQKLDLLLLTADIEVVAFDRDLTELARYAYDRFGKGRHKAALNMGDCAVYALARQQNEPLLCKGEDFIHTDLEVVRG